MSDAGFYISYAQDKLLLTLWKAMYGLDSLSAELINELLFHFVQLRLHFVKVFCLSSHFSGFILAACGDHGRCCRNLESINLHFSAQVPMVLVFSFTFFKITSHTFNNFAF